MNKNTAETTLVSGAILTLLSLKIVYFCALELCSYSSE